MTTVDPRAPRDAERAAASRPDLAAALERFVPQVLRVTGTPGLTVAISADGGPAFEAGYGWADVRRRRAMTPSTITRGGSLAKVYTATAVMRLVESGQLALHEPIRRFVPELAILNPLGDREITVYDLLTLRAGLAAEFAGSHLDTPPSLASYLARAFREERQAEYGGAFRRWTSTVGTAYRYSNLATAALGYLVESVNPERLCFSEYVRRCILSPLGMASTHLPPVQDLDHVPDSILERISTGYVKYRGCLLPSPEIKPAAYPAASLLTTAGDHLRLLEAFQCDGRLDGYRLLQTQTTRTMLTPQVPADGSDDPRGLWTGLGWRMANLDAPDRYFGHEGAHAYGWWNDGRVYPMQRLAVAVFTNAWDMMQWHLPSFLGPTEIMARYLWAWLERQKQGIMPAAAEAPWAWKTSYLMGFLAVERLAGLLAIPGPHPLSIAQAMIDGSLETSPSGREQSWDDDAFRQGFQDGADVDPTPAGLHAFLDSPELKVPREELSLLTIDLGGLGSFPVPLLEIWSQHTQWRGAS